ncbi:Uncharacterised protein (plasmid) [Tsukamurella tyrosinosolvens]|uniref:Uncharacterized protein n=1 Tax=Tsukamurella tyrosinosolvens TaxID=57704 RepID=A0A1H4VKK8_TSUTY|nr:hypothetical protein [Tsukamurella tyrosinosolvens]KXO90955.1 hypothetical protein AXK58_21210 [Tsukamurella tyrosinosolvens]SEC81360.1 hypothetical protein SAMN04489793_3254 [Tsukamurella tyrosinosolvens]VEH90467.1 Uncharacterised protein [Tsukamurella tyrosinosolvens]
MNTEARVLTAAEHRDWKKLTDDFSAALTQAASEREIRSAILGSGEPAWVEYERNVMLFAVNNARLERGRPVVDSADVLRVENTAVGHVDYTFKFALRCAELVFQ